MGQGGGTGQGGGGASFFIPFILMFAFFYFLVIRPQQKKTKEHREMINNLQKGDRVITSGGFHGRITGMQENTLTLEISEKVRVKVNRASISGLMQPAPNQSGKKEE